MDEQQRKALLKETFDTVSSGYDNRALRFFPESAKHLAACLDLRGDEKVLDVATLVAGQVYNVSLLFARREPYEDRTSCCHAAPGSNNGVCARIKEQLLKEFNLHTIIRPPNGVFSPYTSIPTNLLFFQRNGPTKEIWYYEQPLPEGKKNYTKTQPMRFEEFADCIAWWKDRKENEQAWKVKVEDVLKYDADGKLLSANLDIKNPSAKQDFEHLPPEQLVEDIVKKEQRILEIMAEIRQVLAQGMNQ
jgi:hypothetical protein